MQFRSASVGEASFGLALTIGLLLGCSLDDRVSLGRYQELGAAGGSAVVSMAQGGPADGVAGAAMTATPPIEQGATLPTPIEPPPDMMVMGFGSQPPIANFCAGTRYVADLSFVCLAPAIGRLPQPQGTPAPEMLSVMRFGLEPSASVPDTADIVDSNFTFDVFDMSVSGRLTGLLDCASGTFNAAFTDGVADGTSGPPITSVGELSGTLDPLSGRLSGTWWHGPPNTVACTGTWIALPPL